MPPLARFARSRLDRRGIALPLSLFGLILVSVLITGVLLTGATESVISFAHRDATRDLYAAEGAVQAYVAQQNTQLAPVVRQSFTPPGAVRPVWITVEQLAQSIPAPGAGDSSTRYSVLAEPQGGGRAVVGFVQVLQRQLGDFDSDFDGALTLGGEGRVAGTQHTDFKVSDGSDEQGLSCDEEPASNAIVYANDAPAPVITGNTEDAINGDVTRHDDDRFDMVSSILGGVSIRDLAWNADIKFGAYFGEAPWETDRVFGGNSNRKYDWGCPADLIGNIRSKAQGGPPVQDCTADQNYFPVVAIDGENRTVEVSNRHGQGMLIVINGTLKIDGQFIYKGIILAERDVQLAGGGPNWPPSIEGAVLAAGQVVVDGENPADGDGSSATGHRSIRFNRCVINRVQEAFNGPEGVRWGSPTVNGATRGWFEVVR